MPKFKEAPGGEANTIKAAEIMLISADDTTTPNQYIKFSNLFNASGAPVLNPVADIMALNALPTENLQVGALCAVQSMRFRPYVWIGSAWSASRIVVTFDVAPTVNDDLSAGYLAGDVYIDRISETLYYCTDNSTGAAKWVANGGAEWGGITGTLSDQEDLQNALDAKQDKVHLSSSDPTSSDDVTKGYTIGKRWVNPSSKKSFICYDNAIGAAIWENPDFGNFNPIYDTISELVAKAPNDSTGYLKQLGILYYVDTEGGVTSLTYKNNQSLGRAPTVNDDSTQGYQRLSLAVDDENDKIYICYSASEGEAEWLKIADANQPENPLKIAAAICFNQATGVVQWSYNIDSLVKNPGGVANRFQLNNALGFGDNLIFAGSIPQEATGYTAGAANNIVTVANETTGYNGVTSIIFNTVASAVAGYDSRYVSLIIYNGV
jgi:hypothetical protein